MTIIERAQKLIEAAENALGRSFGPKALHYKLALYGDGVAIAKRMLELEKQNEDLIYTLKEVDEAMYAIQDDLAHYKEFQCIPTEDEISQVMITRKHIQEQIEKTEKK